MFHEKPLSFFVQVYDSVQHVIECIDTNATGIALVVDESQKLIATITDGDVRRAILGGLTLKSTLAQLLEEKNNSQYPFPIVAPVGITKVKARELMTSHRVRHLPILDDEGKVVDLLLLDQLLPHVEKPSLRAVVMAGGFGTRLQPLTDNTPKPMLPVGDRPILERIVNQLSRSGVEYLNITTHYMPEKIQEHFGNGDDFGVSIQYIDEEKPLGTAGALSLMEAPDTPFLVMNADILTSVDFQAMYEYHRENQASLTVGVRQYSVQVPYGVVSCEGPFVKSLEEKPSYGFLVNAGIYLLEPKVLEYVPRNTRFDMTDLIDKLLVEQLTVVSFPIVEYWLDIGKHADYEQAVSDVNKGKVNL